MSSVAAARLASLLVIVAVIGLGRIGVTSELGFVSLLTIALAASTVSTWKFPVRASTRSGFLIPVKVKEKLPVGQALEH